MYFLRIEKKVLLKNENQEALDIRFETTDPFYLNRIVTYREMKLGSNIRIQPGECIEVNKNYKKYFNH